MWPEEVRFNVDDRIVNGKRWSKGDIWGLAGRCVKKKPESL